MIKNIKTNLLEKYPKLLEQTKAWDCGYSEAIKRIENNKSNLRAYL